MFKIPAFVSKVQHDKKSITSQPWESSQLDAVQIKKGLADCNVHNKNNHTSLSWELKSQYYIPILATSACVYLTSNAKILKTIVDRYNAYK